jgi:solute carrier family 25 uncoupling protein 8/9
VVYGGLRIGLYEPIRNAMVGKDHVGDVSLGIKIAAGLTTGAIGIAVASPTDLVKVCGREGGTEQRLSARVVKGRGKN